jgi:hypothetical protein
LARTVATDAVVQRMLAYADELEQTATEPEERACALVEISARTNALTMEIKSLVEEAQARLAKARSRLKD